MTYSTKLPEVIQNYMSFEAVLMTGAPTAEPARAVLSPMDTPAAKTAFISGGSD